MNTYSLVVQALRSLTWISRTTSFLFFGESPLLERVTDGEVQRLVALEGVCIEVARTVVVVGNVKAETPVESQNEDVEVVAYTDAGIQSDLLAQILQSEGGVVGGHR